MLKLLVGVLFFGAVLSNSQAYAQLMDLPEVGADSGSGSGGSIYDSQPSYPSNPPSYPSYPSNPPPVQDSGLTYDATEQIHQITRQSQGQWYRLLLEQPVALNRIDIQVIAARLKVYEVVVITEQRQRVQLDSFESSGVFNVGSTITTSSTGGRIIAIDMRMESYGEIASVKVGVIASYGESRPQLAFQGSSARPRQDESSSIGQGSPDVDLYREFYAFATSEYGLNLPDYKARNISAAWSNNRCEGGAELNALIGRFQVAYGKASNSWFRNRTSEEAVKKAAKKVAKTSRCGDLLKNF